MKVQGGMEGKFSDHVFSAPRLCELLTEGEFAKIEYRSINPQGANDMEGRFKGINRKDELVLSTEWSSTAGEGGPLEVKIPRRTVTGFAVYSKE